MRTYSAGSLAYTRSGLVVLFGWLLWGDFVFTLMEAVMPSLLPLMLKDHGATNGQIVAIATTLHMVMNAALNPVISFRSDRLRTRWGRRRPIIVVTTPLVVLFMAATPFAPDILRGLSASPVLRELLSHSPIAPVILIFGVLTAGFQLFNMFISSVYYYLIRDVVPEEMVGRFFGLFRMFGYSATLIFNYFLFGLAESYMKEIFISISIGYGVFILLMCWQVKEGEYLPPPERDGRPWWEGIRTYLRECFGNRYYWWVFLTYSALNWGAAGSVFTIIFFRDDLGFSNDLYGKTMAWAAFLSILTAYPLGVLMDRWGCHRTFMVGLVLVIFSSILMYFLAVGKASGITWLILRNLSLAVCSLSLAKWTVEVYPKERYGQFGSAGALFSSVGGVLSASAFGILMDLLKINRIFLLWHAAFALVALVAATGVYRRWKVVGGGVNYQAP